MKAGNYVRVKDYQDIQHIIKIEKIIDDYTIFSKRGYWSTENIIKSSPNIIDLIEEYDVLKFEYDGIEYIADVYACKGYKEDLAVGCEADIIHIKENNVRFEIKSIVTKEQFESMEYKL